MTAKTVVIGGSGFIGSRLIPELLRSGPVLNLDIAASSQFADKTVPVDVRAADTIAQHLAGAETIVLLAAVHRDDVVPSSLYYDVNVEGMRNVLAAMDKADARRIVFISTVGVYGLDNERPPSESDTPNPFNHYSRSKWMAEQLLVDWVARRGDRSGLILRPTVVFGENNRGNVFHLALQIQRGRFLMVGSGGNRKSMAYVGNLVAFIKFMLDRSWSGVQTFNYADTPSMDMQTLVGRIYEFFGRRAPRTRVPYAIAICAGWAFDLLALALNRPFSISSIRIRKFCSDTDVDASKAAASGFRAPVALADALHRTLAFEFGPQPGRLSPEGSA